MNDGIMRTERGIADVSLQKYKWPLLYPLPPVKLQAYSAPVSYYKMTRKNNLNSLNSGEQDKKIIEQQISFATRQATTSDQIAVISKSNHGYLIIKKNYFTRYISQDFKNTGSTSAP